MRLLPILFLLVILISCKEETAETVNRVRPIKYAVVEKATGLEMHAFSGVAKAPNETNLSFKVGGTLTSVQVELGDRVRKGQVIATIDPVDYNIQTNQAISQKEGSVANAKAAETQLISAQATYNRVVQLYENNSVSLNEYQQAKAGLDAAQAQYDAAMTQIDAADQQLQAAGNQVSYTRLVAPFDGIVTTIQVEANEVVNAGMLIARVSGMGAPEIEVGVPEIFINRIKKGQEVTISLPASPGKEFQGVVDKVSYASGTAPTYPVIIEVEQSVEQIRPGMAANATFSFAAGSTKSVEKMVVPVGAVGKDSEGHFVYILKEEQEGIYIAEKRVITIGKILPEGFELIQGLEGGETVATAGLKSLMDGEQVRLLND